jgi:Membrane domain of glycerophosphoryl diester phosphodiesterase
VAPREDLSAAAIWTAMLEVLRVDFWTLFAVAAPFTLLVDMVMAMFGPAPPKTKEELTVRLVLLLIVLPGLIGAVAQLAVAHLVARPHAGARAALAAAGGAWPLLVGALLLSALPTALGFVLLIVPGLYITARLYLMVPVAVIERPRPVALLQRSWSLTADHGWTILWFLVLAILFLFGAALLVGGVAAALQSVLTLAGMKSVAGFAGSLINAALAAVFSIAGAVASTVIYRKLAV